MELPRRCRGDELLRPGELTAIRQRLRNLSHRHDLTTVIACAFDHRTRMLPFIYADLRMAPAGVRAIGAAMLDAGFHRTRIVLGQWNRNFRPSEMRLDGRVPDLFMVSSMQLHAAHCDALIRDAARIDPAHRPLIIVGGPRFIYEPWEAFSANPANPWGADVAVTGEEYVLLSLLEAVLEARAGNEPLRAAFIRARDSGGLDHIPGLVYARGREGGPAEELVDTGVQRLAGDLDELPDAVLGYRLLEPPGRKATLASHALAADRVRRRTPISSLVTTFGCTFSCPYCPIPAYNQRQHRFKSGERIAEEMYQLYREFGLRYFCLADDNFFDNKQRAVGIIDTLGRAQFDGINLHRKARWVTEVTVHGVLQMADHLAPMRKAGARALWMGVEDMTGTLVQKGQGADKTLEAFALLRESGLCPMPMMMHHDKQPLYTRGSRYGLLNQVRLLRKAGAVSLQVLMMVPAPGSRTYEGQFTAGQVIASAGGRRAETRMFDGSYVITSQNGKSWRKQLNLIAAYLYFYNPLRLLAALVRPKSRLYLMDSGLQVFGMLGLLHTVRRTIGWAWRLWRGPIRRCTAAPASRIPMRGVGGLAASHALPGVPAAVARSDSPALQTSGR
jgi:radical SAM superfamily enzyme YgiQ (UPF0313 family)